MNIKQFEKKFGGNLKQATLTLLLRKNEVLLAMKKRGFGVGKWNGTGGKVKEGETIEQAAIRESEEEIGVTPVDIKKVGVINFYFPHANFGQQVHIFISKKWDGDPAETEEMKPKWFKITQIPYKEMWWDDKYWMPLIFTGKLVRGSFIFGENEEVLDYTIEKVGSL